VGITQVTRDEEEVVVRKGGMRITNKGKGLNEGHKKAEAANKTLAACNQGRIKKWERGG